MTILMWWGTLLLTLGNFLACSTRGKQPPISITQLISWSGPQCQLFSIHLLQKITALGDKHGNSIIIITNNLNPYQITTMCHNNIELSRLTETVRMLRGKNGCPWDKRQTSQTLVKYLQSEVTELIEAINLADTENISEELGDLLYIIVMISEIHAENDDFSFQEVISGITEKLIRRHPHVFKERKNLDDQQLRQQWERIKAEEKSKK